MLLPWSICQIIHEGIHVVTLNKIITEKLEIRYEIEKETLSLKVNLLFPGLFASSFAGAFDDVFVIVSRLMSFAWAVIYDLV